MTHNSVSSVNLPRVSGIDPVKELSDTLLH